MNDDRLVGSVQAARTLGYANPETSGRRMVERQAKSKRCSLHGEDHGLGSRALWKFRVGELARFREEMDTRGPSIVEV